MLIKLFLDDCVILSGTSKVEKNAIAERLKDAEAARKKFDEGLKRYATENVTRDEIRPSLENEVQRLTQTVGQTEGEKREKEEQVARCEGYIDGMQAKLQACQTSKANSSSFLQQYIRALETSLQEEMSRHAPLYGAGLEAQFLKELETLARIHEGGLRRIHSLSHRKGTQAGSPLISSPHTLPHTHPLFPNPPHSLSHRKGTQAGSSHYSALTLHFYSSYTHPLLIHHRFDILSCPLLSFQTASIFIETVIQDI
ncbi:hypothetical protein Nepgr_008869 [Nepenthes gracilis]|uniref:Uncharacterized protein n=1 Tax=Nepenthes gracilis TaxID=150966 RepID=A0AAD3SAE4_NEPGR|nr:hypothetical protein Nepgr_008869 [Nepenthes gracilis]